MEGPVTHPELIAALRQDLRSAGYTVEGVEEVLGPVAAAALHREHTVPAFARLLGNSTPVAVLTWLFALGQDTERGVLDQALPTVGAAGLLELGLVRPGPEYLGGGWVAAAVDLRPYGEEERTWWVCSDLSELATGQPLEPHHVLGIGGASTTLATWTPRPRVARALDLGTGSGVQALHLSGHARDMVATDLSTRALAFARFNAALNEVELDLRQGSLLEPVAGEEFDLIVSNPPFVITPRDQNLPLYEYRDGGGQGDEIVAALVSGVRRHLAPGGIAQLLGNWETGPGQDWRDRIETWLEGTGLDAWVVQREVQDPAEYAETWARDGGHLPGRPGFTTLYSTWLADFARRDVERIGFGIITLHRPQTPRDPWREYLDHRGGVHDGLGGRILAGVLARSWLADHTDEEILEMAWRVARDVTEERIGRPGDPDPAVIQLRQGGGLGRVIRLGSASAAVVSACDGELTAGQIGHAVAALTGADVDEVRAEVIPALRRLIADGFVEG